MANPEHVEKLKKRWGAWNRWRGVNPGVSPDLEGADLSRANLVEANLQLANLQLAKLQLANLVEANLQLANLQGANLQLAKLQLANLVEANLQGANLQGANLQGANLQRANLQRVNLRYADFQKANLRGANLRGADLEEANLQNTRLQGADFQDANLQNTDLAASKALFANFSNANLTGACIFQWGINEQTNLTNVQCDFIYLRLDSEVPTDRRPHDPNEIFKPGDFARLMEQARNTIDLIFSDGIDWQAFLTSFQNLQVSGDHGELSIQGINRKPDDSFVISVEAPEVVDKSAIEADFRTRYESELKQLEAEYQARLQLKDEQVEIYKQQNTDLNRIVELLAVNHSPSIQQNFNAPVYGATGQTENQTINVDAESGDSES